MIILLFIILFSLAAILLKGEGAKFPTATKKPPMESYLSSNELH